jgi:DNA-directed RNA polymerase specialized sigma24 family protein
MSRSFEDFAAAEATPMLRYATALTRDAQLAQDVVQECLLRAQQKWQRIGELDAPTAYVKRMITNEYLSWRRRRAARDVAMSHAALDGVGDVKPVIGTMVAIPQDRLVAIANAVRVDPHADMSWLGRR